MFILLLFKEKGRSHMVQGGCVFERRKVCVVLGNTLLFSFFKICMYDRCFGSQWTMKSDVYQCVLGWPKTDFKKMVETLHCNQRGIIQIYQIKESVFFHIICFLYMITSHMWKTKNICTANMQRATWKAINILQLEKHTLTLLSGDDRKWHSKQCKS